MIRDNYIERQEAETFSKLHAFQLYKDEGIGIINENYSDLLPFILEHKEKNYSELECKLFAELRSIKEEVH